MYLRLARVYFYNVHSFYSSVLLSLYPTRRRRRRIWRRLREKTIHHPWRPERVLAEPGGVSNRAKERVFRVFHDDVRAFIFTRAHTHPRVVTGLDVRVLDVVAAAAARRGRSRRNIANVDAVLASITAFFADEVSDKASNAPPMRSVP